MIIDAFTHVGPPAYLAELERAFSALGVSEPWATIKGLYHVDARVKAMDEMEVDRQVVALNGPPIETVIPDPGRAASLAQLANDGLAELVAKHPKRFIPVGTVALTDVDAAVAEAERCLGPLGMKGIQIYSNVRRRPLDAPEFFPFFAFMERSGLPIWLHPARGADYADYEGESGSKYNINMVFGWAYDTTLAMTRLALGGYFEQLPRLKVIVHHAGAYVPVLANRIESVWGGGQSGYRPMGRRFTYKVVATGETAELSRPPIEYLRMFFTDTVSHGSLAAVNAAYGFFGARNLLFGTDTPFDFAEGRIFTHSHRAVVDSMMITPSDRELIYSGNLLRLIDEAA